MARFVSATQSNREPSNTAINGRTVPAPRGRTAALWVAVVAVAAMLLLLIFILQNGQPSDMYFLGLHGQLSTGVALLLAAVLGALLVTVPALVRRWLRRGTNRVDPTDGVTPAR